MKEEKRMLIFDEYEHGIMVNALNELRNSLIRNQQPNDAVEELLLKTIDAPELNGKRKDDNETR